MSKFANMDIVFIKKLSVFYFSVLADWVLHCTCSLTLLPFGLAGRKASYLLLLPRAATGWSGSIAHYVVVMQALPLCDHIREATSIRKHLVLVCAADKIVWNKILFLVSTSLLKLGTLVRICVPITCLILSLTLDIYWRLRPYSIFGRGGARLLGVTPLFRHHLLWESMLLVLLHIATEQIVMLLGKAKWIWRRAVDVMTSSLLLQTLCVGTCWSLLCCAWTQSIVIVVVVLAWAERSLSPLVSLMIIRILSTAHSFPWAHDVAWVLNAMVLVHLVVKAVALTGPLDLKMPNCC